ncbi:NAD(P)H-dependent flavin oxidoreductase [Anaerosacchariphilus polymeriproducens]|uniref:Probable nitronate monooxygenase n=1 Tax=Anaerosacchariphilus polymeriproducens TaxID=1812858 RepID=A0A371AV08_9FIRM|nr:nitronate monooxygenase [Anaerosacchariphilus polymeriproducens]RDU23310.1 nitronate monooxygenase [Anaerosacchariphilus polymeriproducens]
MELKPLIIGDLVAKVPVIQGGMGVGISLSKLAGAVAAEGGIGIISTAQIGYQEPEFDENPIETNLKAIKKHIHKAKEIAHGGIVGVNIMVATKRYEDYVKAAAKAGVDLIISGAGLPTELPKYIEGFKTKIAPIVSTFKSANVIMKLWDRKYNYAPDLVVIEGPQAGGHLGFSVDQLEYFSNQEIYEEEIKKIVELTSSYAQKYNKNIPVVAAGGIYDRKDMLHYLDLGVDGVQMGTRFVTTYECDADEKYKETYIKSKKEDIQIVKSPVGMPGRAIRNSFLEKKEKEPGKIGKCHQCLEKCNPSKIPYCITDALLNAARGNVEDALLFCGSNAYRAERLEHVSDIFRELTQN